jgi:hypothetical protein
MIAYILLGFYLISVVTCNICNVDNVDNYLTNYLYNQTNTHLQINTINEYTFPFNTCEKVSDGFIAQPYSAMLNLFSSFIISYFLFKTKSKSSKLLLLSILLFELFHTSSHSIHLNNYSQTMITHLLAYFVNFCYMFTLYNYSKIIPNNIFLTYLSSIILFDIYAFNNLSFIFYLTSQFLIFISLFLYYYNYFTEDIKKRIPLIFSLTFSILLLFINETYNCKKMLNNYNWFPFHIFIEITAVFIVYNISSIFSNL